MKHIFKRSLLFLLCVVLIFGATAAQKPFGEYEIADARTLSEVDDDIAEYNNLLMYLMYIR